MNTDNMKNSRTEHETYQQDLARFWQALHDGRTNRQSTFKAGGWRQHGVDSTLVSCPAQKSAGNWKTCGKKDTGNVSQRGRGI
jgi:hypothetical protein